MNKIIRTLLILVAANQLFASASEWEAFKSKHGLKFETRLEESMRESLFNENKARIEKFNAEQSSEAGYTQGLNHFATWTRQEFQNMLGKRPSVMAGLSRDDSPAAQKYIDDLLAKTSNHDIPAEVDWTKVEGRVWPVRNQGNCSCSYAFATTGLLEGQMVPQNKSLVQLSAQNLIDCTRDNSGCDWGFPGISLIDIEKLGGIEAEKDYPFAGVRLYCQFNKSRSAFSIVGGVKLIEGEENLKIIVALHGPVAATMYGDLISFMNYQDGIYYDKECTNFPLFLDQSVLIVGYGTDAETKADYWLVKNSWGTDWGMEGYFKLARNWDNNCGIASETVFPTF